MIFHINGIRRDVPVQSSEHMLGVLRDTLDLTGTRYGCGEGACGACTILVNGKATRSCITAAGDVAGKEIITIEGLEKNGTLHRVQEAFLKIDPFQCSYCASGMIMNAVALLGANASPSEQEIIAAMNGNICRCGTYLNIIEAIQLAIKA